MLFDFLCTPYNEGPMKDLLLIALKKFIEERFVPGKPLLLGYSGGPDSKALLYLLLECRRFFPLDLHLAHIDHGWREESRLEAAAVASEAEKLNLHFHLHVLNPEDFVQGNLESQGREYRYQFFSKLYETLNCQALLIGHHADDQAEVVLKRVFEGSSFFAMSGLSSQSQMKGMQVWRPLLAFHKQDLLNWLMHKKLNYFQDPTNSSDRFLRGRMRQEMMPLLEKSFGKEVASNLCRLGEETREIADYFSELNRPILNRGGASLDLNPFLPMPRIQLKYLLKEWMKKEGVAFSKQILDGAVEAVFSRAPEKKFHSKNSEFSIRNGIILLYNREKIISGH